jgi:hypothetical protein
MPYRSLTITPIMEQSDTSDPQNQVYKVALHLNFGIKTIFLERSLIFIAKN